MKKILIVILISTLSYMLITPFRAYCPIGTSFCVGFVVYFLLFLFFHKKFRDTFSLNQLLLYMLVGIVILDLPLRLYAFRSSLGTLPDAILEMSGIICGYIACRFFPRMKYIPFLIGACICAFMYVKGYPMYRHKLTFGTFTGKTMIAYPLPVQFTTAKGDTMQLKKEQGYALLYYWDEYCGYCIRSFPKLQNVYEEKPLNVQVYAVHIGKTLNFSLQAASFVAPYDFPVLLQKKSDLVLEIDGLPTVFIVDLENERVIFRGNLDNAKRIIQKL